MEIPSKLIYCTPNSGGETAEKFRKNIIGSLKENTGLTIMDFNKSFTFVTDWAAKNAEGIRFICVAIPSPL